jgi:hypothetical protein
MQKSATIVVLLFTAVVFFGNTLAWALWTEQEAKLLASDGAMDDRFGWSVALDADTALVSMPGDDDLGHNAGAAYVFARAGSTWSQQARLVPADGIDEGLFGWSCALDEDTVVISAYWDDDNGFASGSAYVFTRTGGTWTQQAKLLAADGAATDFFGYSVALDGDTALVGAIFNDDNGPDSGSAYVFTRTAGVWTEQGKLLAPDGAADDHFGVSVALDGDTALISATGDDDNGPDSGSVYVFTRTAGVWTQQAKLLAAGGNAAYYFGTSVALHGDTAIVGHPSDGSSSVFIRTAGVWTEQGKLQASDGETGDEFGYRVALDGDTAIIGAFGDGDNGSESGSAYLFTRNGGSWSQQAKLLPADGAAEDYFGQSVALDEDTALIGAGGDNDNGEDSGSAYVFRLYDDEVPATNVVGLALLLLAILATGHYFVRRRVTD